MRSYLMQDFFSYGREEINALHSSSSNINNQSYTKSASLRAFINKLFFMNLLGRIGPKEYRRDVENFKRVKMTLPHEHYQPH